MTRTSAWCFVSLLVVACDPQPESDRLRSAGALDELGSSGASWSDDGTLPDQSWGTAPDLGSGDTGDAPATPACVGDISGVCIYSCTKYADSFANWDCSKEVDTCATGTSCSTPGFDGTFYEGNSMGPTLVHVGAACAKN